MHPISIAPLLIGPSTLLSTSLGQAGSAKGFEAALQVIENVLDVLDADGQADGALAVSYTHLALTNTRKHAGEGAKATIDEIWSNDVLSITVSDNGRGAASAADGHKPGYGLVGICLLYTSPPLSSWTPN